MLVVLFFSWLRCFAYFLLVRSISKLLLTLFEMIIDTLSFLLIFGCYMILTASVFTTLYQDQLAPNYGNLLLSIRTLFDAGLAVYSYKGMENKELQHSILIILHVFITNVLLLNYLIAILSTTYENMKQSGIFKYKVNLYMYCETYMQSFFEGSIGEMILHPPPLSLITIFILPTVLCKKTKFARCATKGFSYLMFWMENLVFLSALFLYEIVVLPICFIKVFFNLLKAHIGFFTKVF
jgi:hypothetical protein